MVIELASASWGPQFIVPCISIKRYYGCVLLRQNLDDDLLRKELNTMEISGRPAGYVNVWHIRKKGTSSWIRIGESSDRERDFCVRLNTRQFQNGLYQILGFLSVTVKSEGDAWIISKQNIADFDIHN